MALGALVRAELDGHDHEGGRAAGSAPGRGQNPAEEAEGRERGAVPGRAREVVQQSAHGQPAPSSGLASSDFKSMVLRSVLAINLNQCHLVPLRRVIQSP